MMKFIVFLTTFTASVLLYAGNKEPTKDDFVIKTPLTVSIRYSLGVACGRPQIIRAEAEVEDIAGDYAVHQEWKIKQINYVFTWWPGDEADYSEEHTSSSLYGSSDGWAYFEHTTDVPGRLMDGVGCTAIVEYYVCGDNGEFNLSGPTKTLEIVLEDKPTPAWDIIGVKELIQSFPSKWVTLDNLGGDEGIKALPGETVEIVARDTKGLMAYWPSEYYKDANNTLQTFANPVWKLTSLSTGGTGGEDVSSYFTSPQGSSTNSFTVPDNSTIAGLLSLLPSLPFSLKCSCGSSSVSIPVTITDAYVQVYLNAYPFSR